MKIILKVFLVSVVLLCCSCAPGLNSIRDVDCYLEKERTSTNWPILVKVETPEGRSVGLGDALGGVSGIVMALTKPSKFNSKGEVRAYIPLAGSIDYGRYIAYYRKEPGKPVFDLREEVLKKAGAIPERPSCEIKHFSMEPILGFNKDYDFGDSQVKLSKGLLVQLHFNAKDYAEPPCNRTDFGAYVEYISNIVRILEERANEEFSHPSPYCPADCR